MFNKLLRNLPFNPSLIDQVSFYSKRLSKEAGIRRLGFILIAMTMALQVFATLAPAQASLACDPSNNDILQCGFKTKAEAVDKCNAAAGQGREFRIILLYHGITCDKLATATERTISTRDYNNRLRSVGRKPFNKPGEYTQNIPGVGNLFWRPLSSWGTFSTRVLQTQTNDGQMIMVMFECGNLIRLNDFVLKQPAPDSDLNIVKINNPTGEVKPGDTIKYTLAFSNKGGDAAFFSVHDLLPRNVTLLGSEAGNWAFDNQNPHLSWNNNIPPYYVFGNTDHLGTPGFITVTVRVNDRVPSGTTLCNTAYVQDVPKGTSTVRKSGETQVCNTVSITCAEGQFLGEDGYTCEKVLIPDAICLSLTPEEKADDKSHKTYMFTTQADSINGAAIQSYTYDFGDGSKKVETSTAKSNTVEHKYGTAKTYDVSVAVKTSVDDKPALTCKAKAPVRPEDKNPVLSLSKRAANITKGIKDANGTTASAGDVIEYSLTTKNISDVDDKNASLLPEDLGDVLEYSDLDLNSLHGGVFDAEKKVLAWNGTMTIKAGESVTKVFRVTVKNPIPSTPSPDTTNQSAGDLVMHNQYGNSTIDINLPRTPVKTAEQINSSLPKTGPGSSLVIGFVTMTIVGYFFARSRLLAKELVLVKQEYTETSGGL
jgi:uncharacterized repeat protein (TIGR01451 family)